MLSSGGEGGREGGTTSELKAVNAVLHGDASDVLGVELRPIRRSVMDGDADCLAAGNDVAIDVREQTLLVDERRDLSLKNGGAEQADGGEKGFHTMER